MDGQTQRMVDYSNPTGRNPTLRDLIEALREIYEPEGVVIWLLGHHRLLDNRAPADVWDENPEAVMALVHQIQTGAFV